MALYFLGNCTTNTGTTVAPAPTMLSLNRDQRQMLSDKLPDAANLAIGALFFGQFLSDKPFSTALALTGSAAWLALMMWAIQLARRKSQ